MQIGIDLGATKIEYVVLKKNGEEILRNRIKTPNSYKSTLKEIKNIVKKIDKQFKKKLIVGVCHPGSIDKDTQRVKNSTNANWLNQRKLNFDLKKILRRNVFCENDANCFTLSEAIDGSGKHYKIVFGIILGSGVGGGLVIDKKIVSGPHGITGEWGHNQLPMIGKETIVKKNNLRDGEIESSISGLSLSKQFKRVYKKNLKAHEIFELYRKHDLDAERLVEEFKDNLSMAIASVVNILDPDVFIFGGGLSNEIDFFNEIQSKVRKFVAGNEFEGIFLKPKFGDASGVRGAARLGRNINY